MTPTPENTTYLSEQECWERLQAHEFGRLAYHLADEVHIVPINYAVDGERIFFRTAEGSKLLGVVMNTDVAFEIDQVDDDANVAWSVIARGSAEVLDGQAARDARALGRPRPWVDSAKFNIVAITVDEITGRAFHLAERLDGQP